ncbi:hypothetical protein GCM10027030_18390 [Luteococcus sediminum]
MSATARPLIRAGMPGTKALSAWFQLVISCLLGIALPAILVAEIPNTGRSEAWMLGLLIMPWAAFHLAADLVRGTPRLFSFFFWLFNYIFMGIAATAQLRSNTVPWTTLGMPKDLDLTTMLLVVTGLLCYEVGSFFASRKPLASRTSVVGIHPARAVAMTLLSLLLAAAFLAKVGIQKAYVSRDEGGQLLEAAFPDPTMSAIIQALATFPLLMSVGACASLARDTPRNDRRVGYVLLCLAGSVLVLLINSPLSSARYTFGTVAFALVVFAGMTANKVRTRLLLGGTIFGFLFLFPLANAFRTAGAVHERSSFFGEYPANPDYDAFWMIGNSWLYWDGGHATPLRQITGSLFFWLPRSVWPDKPLDTSIELANFRGYGFTNLSAPLWGEAIVNGGLIGMVIVFLATGWFLRRLDGHFEATFRRSGWWLLVMGVFPVYLNILLRGSLLQATGSLMVATASALVLRDYRGNRSTRDIPRRGTE